MRGVVRTVLQQVAKSGLPGNHHFFIAFDTLADGVTISKRLLEKYPTEMTIVLQHRFWDLHVTEERFEVKLSFDAIPERLVVPFAAVKVFYDPSVPYGLQFDDPNEDVRTDGGDVEGRNVSGRSGTTSSKKRATRKTAKGETRTTQNDTPVTKADPLPVTSAKRPAAAKSDHGDEIPSVEPAAKIRAVPNDEGGQGAKVVSLDQFRKK
ncbi:MAG: ClpXP protease specificity-enhancing factor SspB [Hyphomicrobiaceae bacterium]